mgnify:CR=1 FL=1
MNDIDTPLEARFPNQATPELDGDRITLMWMPGGRPQPVVSRGDEAVALDIDVRAEDAGKVQTAFEALCAAGPHKPYFDLEHDDKCAAVWPERFEWRESPQPGIYAMGTLSKALGGFGAYLAAARLGLGCIGFDLDESYLEFARARLRDENFTVEE